LQFLVYLGFNY